MSSDSLESADLFKILAWLEKNKKQVTYGIVAALAIALIAFFISWRTQEARLAAGQAFSTVFAAQTAAGTNATAEPYLSMASKYPGSTAAERALIIAGTTLFTNGKYAEAQAEFEKFTREHRDSMLKPEALLGIAASLEAQNKIDPALAAYKDIVDRRAGESILPQAKFQLARLYEAKNDLKKAHELYKDVASTESGSLGDEAGVRSRELELKDPSLAPVASAAIAPAVSPTPTNAPKK